MADQKNNHICSACGSEFSNGSKLQRHKETHNLIGSNLCLLCDTLFQRDSNLIDHWRNACKGVKAIASNEERKTLERDDLREKVYRYILDIQIASTSCDDDDSQTSNSRNSTDGSMCNYCNVLMPYSTIEKHHEIHTKRSLPGSSCFACDLCGLGFRSSKSLIQHWRETCGEVLAQFHPIPVNMYEDELIKLVGELVEDAVVVDPTYLLVDMPSQSKPQNERTIEQTPGTSQQFADDFKTKMVQPPSVDVVKWKRLSDPVTCLYCDRAFANVGRLDRHIIVFHKKWKSQVKCELCMTNTKMMHEHLRKNCKVMKSEFTRSNVNILTISNCELLAIYKNAKKIWCRIIKGIREKAIKEMTAFLYCVDNPIPVNVPVQQRIIDAHVTILLVLANFSKNICPYCKTEVKFTTKDFLKKHILMVHKYRVEIVLNQENVKIQKNNSPLFYNQEGKEFRLGSLLNENIILVNYFKNKPISNGMALRIVYWQGFSQDFIIINIEGVSGNVPILIEKKDVPIINGTPNMMFYQTKQEQSDIPVLEKQA